jgi:hypothetical protein
VAFIIATNAWRSSLRLSSPGKPLPTLQILRRQWARWFDLLRRSDLNLVKWKYQLRSFNVRQDFGQRQCLTIVAGLGSTTPLGVQRVLRLLQPARGYRTRGSGTARFPPRGVELNSLTLSFCGTNSCRILPGEGRPRCSMFPHDGGAVSGLHRDQPSITATRPV